MANTSAVWLLSRRPGRLLILLHLELWFITGNWGSWIIGGKEATPHSRPYLASIQIKGEHVCGGVLVQHKWVMTAAHCSIPRRDASARVVLGAHSLKKHEDSQQTVGILDSIAHPLYDPQTVKNDIRLLKLNQSAILNRFIQCIRLPEPDVDLHPGVRCQVSGWGDISNYRTVPSQLMEVNTTVVNREVCNASWVGHVYSCMICAANPKPTLSGFCTGDSGGPLVCGNKVHGIVSFNGKRCGYHRFPDVYTRVSKYVAWVHYVLRNV